MYVTAQTRAFRRKPIVRCCATDASAPEAWCFRRFQCPDNVAPERRAALPRISQSLRRWTVRKACVFRLAAWRRARDHCRGRDPAVCGPRLETAIEKLVEVDVELALAGRQTPP